MTSDFDDDFTDAAEAAAVAKIVAAIRADDPVARMGETEWVATRARNWKGTVRKIQQLPPEEQGGFLNYKLDD